MVRGAKRVTEWQPRVRYRDEVASDGSVEFENQVERLKQENSLELGGVH